MAGIFNVSPNSNLTKEDKKLLIDNLKFRKDKELRYAPGDPITKAYSRVPFANFSEQGQDYLQSLWLTFEDNDDVEITFSGSWGASTYVCNPRIYGHWAGVNNEVLNDIYRDNVLKEIRIPLINEIISTIQEYNDSYDDVYKESLGNNGDLLQDYYNDTYEWIKELLSGYPDRIKKQDCLDTVKDNLSKVAEKGLNAMRTNYCELATKIYRNAENMEMSNEECFEIARALQCNFSEALGSGFIALSQICEYETGYDLNELCERFAFDGYKENDGEELEQ